MGDTPNYCSRPCLLVAHGVKWLPVAFIVAVVSWSYYAYVVQLNVYTVSSAWEKSVYLLVYHALFVLFAWSYWRTVLTEAGGVSEAWILTPRMHERLKATKTEEDWKALLELLVVEMGLPVLQCSVQGAVRYCETCKIIKPDRSHHCSVCEKCVRKMDHHCPWVNNCVAYNNYKYFILFLGYALLYCFWIAATSAKYFVRFWTDNLIAGGGAKFHVFFLLLVSGLFFISVSSLFWYHVYLVLSNRSTLEQFRAPYFRAGGQDDRGWSLGKMNNFKEVFGSDPKLWFIPVPSSMGDGLVFPTGSDYYYRQRSEEDGVKIATEVVVTDTGEPSSQLVRVVNENSDRYQ